MEGAVISERYEILDTLGQGGMGVVLKCQDTILKRVVAVKVLATATTGTAIKRFQLEARAAAKLKQANILQVHDFGETSDGRLYLVMDFVEGMTLEELLKERKFLPIEEASPLFLQICKGIAHAHGQGVLHRDIKPSNIMLADTDKDWVKIVDFGIAKLNSEEQRLTSTGALIGSPPYMAPEAILNKEVDARSDIYSIGCVMFETLTGSPPFEGETAMATVMMHTTEPIPSVRERSDQELPAQVETIVGSCLAKNPNDRYRSIDALLADLEDLEKTLQEEAEQDEQRRLQAEKINQADHCKFVEPAATKKSPTVALIATALVVVGIGLIAGMNTAKIPLVPEPSPDEKTDGKTKIPKQDFNHLGELRTYGEKYEPMLTRKSNVPQNTIEDEVGADGNRSAKATLATDDDEVIKRFEKLKTVGTWRLSDSQIGLKAIKKITEAPVEFLELKNTSIDDACIEAISTMKQLKGLQLGGCMGITATGYKPLIKNKQLFTLQISLPNDQGKAMKVLDTLSSLEALTDLDIRGTMNGALIKRIPSFKRLDTLQLETPTADGWREMKRLGHLRIITLVVSDKDHDSLEMAKKLSGQIQSTVLTKPKRRGSGSFDESINEQIQQDVEAKKQIPFF